MSCVSILLITFCSDLFFKGRPGTEMVTLSEGVLPYAYTKNGLLLLFVRWAVQSVWQQKIPNEVSFVNEIPTHLIQIIRTTKIVIMNLSH